MRTTFMAGHVQGTKLEIKKANRVANIIAAIAIISFLTTMISILTSTGAFAQNTKGAEVDGNLINMMDEIQKPYNTVMDNLELDQNVNTVEKGTNRYGFKFIKATYYDTGNTVTHLFSNKNECISVEFKSTNFRNYNLFLKAVNDTFDNANTFEKVKHDDRRFIIDLKIERSVWFIKIKKRA